MENTYAARRAARAYALDRDARLRLARRRRARRTADRKRRAFAARALNTYPA